MGRLWGFEAFWATNLQTHARVSLVPTIACVYEFGFAATHADVIVGGKLEEREWAGYFIP